MEECEETLSKESEEPVFTNSSAVVVLLSEY